MCRHLNIRMGLRFINGNIESFLIEENGKISKIAKLIKEYDERFSHILGYRRMTDWINHFNQTHFSRKENPSDYDKNLKIHSVIRKEKKKKYNTSNGRNS